MSRTNRKTFTGRIIRPYLAPTPEPPSKSNIQCANCGDYIEGPENYCDPCNQDFVNDEPTLTYWELNR